MYTSKFSEMVILRGIFQHLMGITNVAGSKYKCRDLNVNVNAKQQEVFNGHSDTWFAEVQITIQQI